MSNDLAPKGARALSGPCPACGGPTAIRAYRATNVPGTDPDVLIRTCISRLHPTWPCLWSEYVCDLLPVDGEARP